MLVLGPLGFTAPWLLMGLIALPVLWWLLRAVPPAPIRRRFPGVALLLGLKDDETQTDRTPWWLLLLRMLAIAAVIVGFSGPVLNPEVERTGSGPLLVLVDGTWADARDWQQRQERIADLLSDAGRVGRPVAVVALTDLPADGPAFQSADVWVSRLPAIRPAPWEPGEESAEWTAGLEGSFQTYWLSDGLARVGRAEVLAALESHGSVTVFESPRPLVALRPAVFDEGVIRLTGLRPMGGEAAEAPVTAIGLDPVGIERDLAGATLRFDAGATEAEVAVALPAELRNRISRFQVGAIRSAGAVSLTDDGLKRRKVALLAGRDDREGLELLSPLHYLRQALDPVADLIDGSVTEVLMANPDVIVLADVARMSDADTEAVTDWVDGGGLLLRFAGPRLAASDLARAVEDPLMPVRLREGGRTVGGAMSWGEPKALRPFADGSPFYGLTIPEDVIVSAQVVAQPDPELADRTIATLADGTPLVTRKRLGQGQVVLVHVTANAEWSTLPLSGLFVQMLERLAVSTRPAQLTAEDLAGSTWVTERLLDAYGTLSDAGQTVGVSGEALAEGRLGADLPPGVYADGDRRVALNVVGTETVLSPAEWPGRIVIEGASAAEERQLKGMVLTLALLLLLADILASLALSGRLRGAGGVAAVALALFLAAPPAQAQDGDQLALRATAEVVLAHVLTGDPAIDRMAEAGLRGLSRRLYERTSVEPAEPIGVDLERDDLAMFPFLYWPVTDRQQTPSAEAYARLNQFLRTGGLILFDTRDADVAGFGGATPAGRRLQSLAAPLDIPALEPVPPDHVLTRTFYLLQEFPGRHTGRTVWVEAAPPDAEQVEGMPFRNLNDGVTPVVIGGNDWAAAWAMDDRGGAMAQIGRGFAGERQREIAFRFGINLIMHVLTGNYKSDQVHVPALLERLGQ